MKRVTASFMLACVFLLSAGLHASAIRHLSSISHRRLSQAGQLGYVPQGCQGIQLTATAYHGFTWEATPIVYGTVVINNPNNFPVPLDQVLVQVNNNIPVAPVFVNATCPSTSVPAAGGFTAAGTLTCTYRVALPDNGIAAGAARWPSVTATATLDMSGAQCSSPVTQIDTSFWARLAQGLMNSFDPSSSGTGAPQGLTATQGASNAGGRRRLSQTEQAQMGPLGYVPSGCQGLTVTTFAQASQQPGIISGTVVMTNPGTFDIPITSVDVTLGNDIPVAPLYTTATCPGSVVPANPQPYTVGELVCTFAFALPQSGPAAGSDVWTGASATAAIAMSNATCSSPVAMVGPPLVYGR